jgi:hypothetical protein
MRKGGRRPLLIQTVPVSRWECGILTAALTYSTTWRVRTHSQPAEETGSRPFEVDWFYHFLLSQVAPPVKGISSSSLSGKGELKAPTARFQLNYAPGGWGSQGRKYRQPQGWQTVTDRARGARPHGSATAEHLHGLWGGLWGGRPRPQPAPWPAFRRRQALDSASEERDGGVPRGPGGPPHKPRGTPDARESVCGITDKRAPRPNSLALPARRRHEWRRGTHECVRHGGNSPNCRSHDLKIFLSLTPSTACRIFGASRHPDIWRACEKVESRGGAGPESGPG